MLKTVISLVYMVLFDDIACFLPPRKRLRIALLPNM